MAEAAYKVLVVDDSESIKKYLSQQLKQIGCDVATATGATAIGKAIQFIPDMVLLDIEMPAVNGFEVLRELRAYDAFKTTPVIMLSALSDRTNVINSFKRGANDYIVKPFNIGVLFGKLIGWQNAVIETQWHGLSHEQGKALRLLKVMMEESFENLRKSIPLPAAAIRNACEILYFTIETEGADAILRAVEGYNTTMFLHSLLMCVYIMLFTKFKGYPIDDVIDLSMGGLLHDIGSVKISNEILYKPGKLDITEYNELKLHVQYGVEIMDKTPDIPQKVKNICSYHHERMDGSGYLQGLKADKICPEARLAAVVETYCAITTKTVYRESKTTEEALSSMMTFKGQLDPEILDAFKDAASKKFKSDTN